MLHPTPDSPLVLPPSIFLFFLFVARTLGTCDRIGE